MNRAEALRLVGETVQVWTAMNGQYVGILEEVTSHRPWRGRVRITGVLSPACMYEYARGVGRQRRGFEVGEMIEAGNSSIKPSTLEGTSYTDALRRELEYLESQTQEMRGRNPWVALGIENIRAELLRRATAGEATGS